MNLKFLIKITNNDYLQLGYFLEQKENEMFNEETSTPYEHTYILITLNSFSMVNEKHMKK